MIVIADLDGTLAECGDRIHYIKDPSGQILPKEERRWDLFHQAGCQAKVIRHVALILTILHRAGNAVHILTGRSEDYLAGTRTWFHQHQIPYNQLFMRSPGDYRSDIEFKGDRLEHYRPDEVLCILEDRETVVHMARTMGFTVFQVAPGAF